MKRLFGVDWRALAAFRMGIACMLLVDLWYRSQELGAFFTDSGILPRQARIGLVELGDRFGREHAWSLHMLSGEAWMQGLLIGLAAASAVALLFGYRTRSVAVASWILVLSLDGRNPAILDSGDVLLRCMLFWSLFLPLGACFSVDQYQRQERTRRIDPSGSSRRLDVRTDVVAWNPVAALERALAASDREAGGASYETSNARRGREPTPLVCNVASAGLLLQLAMMYFFSALFKTHPVWIRDCSAVYYALHCDAFATRWGIALRGFPWLLEWLTLGSYLLELVGPLLAFSPWATSRIRILVVFSFWLFHLGLSATLMLGIFPWICIACWVVYLPPAFWDAGEHWMRRVADRFAATPFGMTSLGRFLGRCNGAGRSLANCLPPATDSWLSHVPGWFRRTIQALIQISLAALLVYLIAWNIRELNVRDLEKWVLPLRYNGPARALGLDQNWSMFSPVPRTEDGWLLMVGTLDNGRQVNLWQPEKVVPWDKPQLVSSTFRSQRWLKYLDNLTTDAYIGYRDYFCEWLAARWNRLYARSDQSQRVVKVELYHAIELTPPPGQPIPEPEIKPLYTYYPLYYDP
jgi:hypothetical protein